MTGDFTKNARASLADVRTSVAAFRSQSHETLRQIAKVQKALATGRNRLVDRLGTLADDVVEKLPSEATSTDVASASAIQAKIQEIAAEVEDLSFAESALDDLRGALDDTVAEILGALKAAEAQVAAVERSAARLGI